LGPEKGTEALGVGARAVVVNEGVKRRGFRGVVDIVRPAEGGEKERENGGEEVGGGKKQQKKQQQNQNQQKNQNQKRKNGDAGGIGGAGDTGGKRQAKKMKKDGPKGS